MDHLWQYSNGRMSISCTPHFKHDAEKPWVTKESASSMHYWFNPEKEQTLIEVVKQIEEWIRYDFAEVTLNRMRNYHMGVQNMEIRGINYKREELANKTTGGNLRDEEPFTLRINSMYAATAHAPTAPRCIIQ